MTDEQRLMERAFEIADASMLSLLWCATLRIDDVGMACIIVDDDDNGVHDLSEASHGIAEAVEWLTQRGIVEIVESPDGLVAVIKRWPK